MDLGRGKNHVGTSPASIHDNWDGTPALGEAETLGYSTPVAPPTRRRSLAWALVAKLTGLRGGKPCRVDGVFSASSL